MKAECSDKRPNIIFLLTDDQRWDTMGCAGNPYIKTPNMDSMAAEGVRFSNAFVTTPICCSSRASIFSGQYARRHGIHDFEKDFTAGQLAQTYPVLLRQAGYRTGFVGKYGVGTSMPEQEFDGWQGMSGQPVYENTDECGNYRHLTGIMGDQSIDFIEGCDRNQPFCLSVSFKAPHVQDEDPRQFIYDRDLADMYADVDIPLPETADEKYLEVLPKFLRDEATEARRRWGVRFSTPEKYQESVKGYYRLISGVDIVVGRIRAQLEQSGLAENTVIIFMGDNGFFLGEKGLAGKWYPLEESIRVPLVVFDPRLKESQRGRVVADLALNIDIAPTILDLGGVLVPGQMQGQSLARLMRGEAVDWRDDFLIEHLFEYKLIPKSEAVRTRGWKYLRYFHHESVHEELYDLIFDPHELNNLANDEQVEATAARLRSRCNQLIEQSE